MDRAKPPDSLLELSDFGIRQTSAPEVWEWLQAEILGETGSIHNEDHAHLLDADILGVWASSSFEKQGRIVLGQAEQVFNLAAVHYLRAPTRSHRPTFRPSGRWGSAGTYSRSTSATYTPTCRYTAALQYWLPLRVWRTQPSFTNCLAIIRFMKP